MHRIGLLAIALLSASCGFRANMPPLIGAAREGRVDLIPALVKQGADPNERAGVNGWTPLMHAIHKNQKGSVIALLNAGADINGRSQDGSTALMMAAGYGYTDIVNLLLDRGADAHAQLSDGMNALTFAVIGTNDIDRFTVTDCQGPTIKALIEHNPDLKLRGSTRVMKAVAAAKLKSCVGVAALLGNRYP
jgi:ankyrin repeat protein